MLNDGITNTSYLGKILPIGCAICFSGFITIVRKNNSVDMMPTSLIAGVSLAFFTSIIKFGNISIPISEIFLCLFWGAALHGFMNIVFIFSTKYLYASEVSLFMLLEFCLGPFWVWIFLDELISYKTFIGGVIVLLSVSTYSFLEFTDNKNKFN